jgi:hypothetical protein
LARLARGAKPGPGWTVDDAGVLRVRVPDHFGPAVLDVAF